MSKTVLLNRYICRSNFKGGVGVMLKIIWADFVGAGYVPEVGRAGVGGGGYLH